MPSKTNAPVLAVPITTPPFGSTPRLTTSRKCSSALASGQTNPRRARDLADVQELIALLRLPQEFAEQLNPYVRDKYRELWAVVHDFPAEL